MLVLHPTRDVVYTTNLVADTVSIIEPDRPQQPGPPPRITTVDLQTMTVAGSVQAGQAPDGLAWVGGSRQ